MTRPKVWRALLLAISLSACATYEQVLRDGPRREFQSSLPADKAAVCIDRNADDYFFFTDILKSEVSYVAGEPTEVIVRNGKTYYAIARVKPAETGSIATFSFGGYASTKPDEVFRGLTKGCE